MSSEDLIDLNTPVSSVLDLLKLCGISPFTGADEIIDNPTYKGTINLTDFLFKIQEHKLDYHHTKQRNRNNTKVNLIYQSLISTRVEVDDIYKYQTGTWTITFVTINDKDAKLVDGAHRCEACLKGLPNLYSNVVIYNVTSETERHKFFLDINQSTDLAAVYRNNIIDMRKQFVSDFFKQYNQQWINKEPMYYTKELFPSPVPYVKSIDEARFIEITEYIWESDKDFTDYQSMDKFIEIIDKINSYLSKKDFVKDKLALNTEIQKAVSAKICRAYYKNTKGESSRCTVLLDKSSHKSNLEKGLYLCGYHDKNSLYEKDNYPISLNDFIIEADTTGCYLGFITTKEEWKHYYESALSLPITYQLPKKGIRIVFPPK